MGCDIHVLAEFSINNEWINCDAFFCDHDGNSEFEMADHSPLFRREVYENRNYMLFGILAGVRGDYQLFEQRGVPSDMHKATAAEIERWEGDGHSHSYLTFRELYNAWIDEERKRDYKDEYTPADALATIVKPLYVLLFDLASSWCYSTGSIKTPEEMVEKLGDRLRIVFFFDN